MNWSLWFSGLTDAGPNDRMYNCLPMYHSVGGVVAVWSVLLAGGCVVLRARFSASSFWDDVAASRCTMFQYIGELCRYLLNAPDCEAARRHGLRLVVGNGLRADVWTRFQRRFDIPRILEFYAATESNFSLYNVEGEPGAIGRVPAFLAHRFQIALVAIDEATRAPARGTDGFCIASASAKRAKQSPGSKRGKAPAPVSTAMLARKTRTGRSCAMSSSPATRGCAAAISCARTRAAITISPIA